MFRKFGLGFSLAIAAILAGCGGGGGGAPAATAPTCAITQTSNGSTLCLNEIKINGASYAGADIFYAAAAKLKDNNTDIVYSLANVATNSTPSAIQFLKGTADPYSFTTWNPTITGAGTTAQAHYARDIVFGDFGDGKTGMYIADQSEYKTNAGSSTFDGVNQYVYTNDGAGNFTKTLLDFGVGSVHGSAVGNFPTDGFSIFFNNPFTANPNIAAIGNDITNGTTQAVQAISGGKCFYSAAVMLKHASSFSGTNSTKRDLICFSQGNNTALVTDHSIFFNNGAGAFSTQLVLATSAPQGWTVEDVVVGNFSGRTDGREDFVVLYVNRSVANNDAAFENTSVKIYVPDANGVPQDQTANYFGAGCVQCADFTNDVTKFHRIKGVDVNNDGKLDLTMVRQTTGAPSYTRQLEVLVNAGGSFARKTFTAGNSYMGYNVTPVSSRVMVTVGGKLYLGAVQ